jgi:hypothetical protein
MQTRLFLFACVFAVVAAPSLCATPPLITQFTPFAITPGKTTDLTLRGQGLLAARSIWTTFANRCEFLPADDESAQKGEKLACRITLPREVQVGIGAIRLITAEGVSNPVLLMLDDLPTVVETSENHVLEQAQPVQLPTAIDGQCDPVQEDLYRFSAAAGQRLSFEVVAQRLGSKLDPLLRILSTDGKEVARLDDAEGAAGDVRFTHTFAAAGEYLAALRDVRHAGGAEHRYRLRIGSFPLITHVYPAGGRSGVVMSLALAGQALDSDSPLNVVLPQIAGATHKLPLGLPSRDNAGSGWFQVEASPSGEALEAEPNDDPATATEAQFPGALNGRFDKANDRDHFKFHATKGQRLHCVAKTRELGSACDVYLSLLKSDGAQIAVARQETQSILDAEIPEDGDYFLQVEDLLVGGPVGHVYRIDITDAYTGFSLSAEQTQYTAPHAGTVAMKVLAQRRGYDGPIDLHVEGLDDGLTLEGNKLEGAEALLKVTVPATIPQGEMRLASIVGTAKVGDATVAVKANQRAPLTALFPNAPSLPTELEDTVPIGVGPPFPPFFDLNLAQPDVIFPQLVGESSFDINIARSNDAFKDPVTIAVEGLPAEIQATIAPVDDGLKAVRVSLKGSADLAEREVPIRIVGTGRFQDQTRAVTLPDVKLRVTKPLVARVTMAGPIAAGGAQHADVQLQRFGGDPQPVRLQVNNGPMGLSAPIFVTVPADAAQTKISFTADATAPTGRFDNLTVVATTTYKGQSITVESQPAAIEITPPATP